MSNLTPEIKAMIDGWSYQSLLRKMTDLEIEHITRVMLQVEQTIEKLLEYYSKPSPSSPLSDNRTSGSSISFTSGGTDNSAFRAIK